MSFDFVQLIIFQNIGNAFNPNWIMDVNKPPRIKKDIIKKMKN